MAVLRYVFLVMIIAFLSNCQKEQTYSQLMQHPDQLQTAYLSCEKEANKESCEVVRRAMQDYMVLLNQQNQDPEGFGLKILKTQQHLVHLKLNYEHALKESDQNNLQLTREAYEDEKEQLQIYYAVVAKIINE